MQLQLFLEELEEKDILKEWGGSNPMQIYDSKYERQLRQLVDKLNAQ